MSLEAQYVTLFMNLHTACIFRMETIFERLIPIHVTIHVTRMACNSEETEAFNYSSNCSPEKHKYPIYEPARWHMHSS